ncbi:glycoside hydrolase family 5 protein [Parasediminibacterium sp. JCM 36343]|uniref:glycoside hydrolase family 5 protein n=1 Tax=Parasediminibacterium sp. JCM 36343 TaxID=3374279 RepID=UPI00397B00C4
MKRIITLIAIIVVTILKVNAQQYNALPFGVSLCGAEFGTDNLPGVYNTNYIYPDKNEIQYFARKGVSVMQLPFRWERIQKRLGGPLDATELAYMKRFLNDCAASGVMVVLNMHNFARYKMNNVEYIIGTPQVPVAAFKDVWTKMAAALNGFDNIYALDIMNEPHDMGNNSWFNAAQQAINGIRQVNRNIYIMVEGESYSNAPLWAEYNDNLKNLYDPADNIIYNAHCYFDGDLSGTYAKSYDAENITPQTGIDKVSPFVNWLKANRKKGFVGEFGVPKNDRRWLPVLDNFLRYLTDNGISGSYWAAGPWWKSYPLSLHPIAGNDQPQMGIYAKYLQNNGVAVARN